MSDWKVPLPFMPEGRTPDWAEQCRIRDERIKELEAEKEKLGKQNYALINQLAKAVDRAQALEAERDALKADAERYRWLKNNMTHYNPAESSGPVLSGARIWYHASDNVEWPLDAAIDAAMNGEKPL